MIKKYNEYIKEGFTNRYPFERIMILINNVDEYYKVYDFVEKEFNIKIRKDRNVDYLEGEVIIHIMLNVRIMYDILYRLVNFVKETDILRFFSTEYGDIDILINAIKQQCDSNYFNEKDILSIDELSSVISLLRTGKKVNFNYLYNKPRKNVYESLLDKISGPSKDDVENYYNDEYKKGNIDIVDFYKQSQKLNISGPTEEEVLKYLKKDETNITLDEIIKINSLSLFKNYIKYKKINVSSFLVMLSNEATNIIKYIKSLGITDRIILPSGTNKDNFLNSLEYYIEIEVDGVLDVLEMLFNYGIEVKFNNKQLRRAVRYGNYNLVEFMLEHGADPSENNNQALRWGETFKQHDIVNLLKKYIKE